MIGLSARNENLRPLRNTNITLISRTYCLRNHFHHWKVVFSWGKVRKGDRTQKPFMGQFRSFGIDFYLYFCERKSKKSTRVNFFFSWCMFRPHVNLKWTAVLMTWKKFLLLHGGGGDYYSFATVSSLHWNIKLEEYNCLKWLGGRPVISGPSTDTAFPLSAQPRSFVHQPAFWAGALLQVCNRLLVSQTQFWAFQDIFRCNHQWYSAAGMMQVRGLFPNCYLSSDNIISSSQTS